jgi:CRP-like cAMP-binding protein
MADDLLASSEFFADVAPEMRVPVAGVGQRRRLVRRDVLFAEGDDSSDLSVVIAGRIAIANRSSDGRESVVALMENGDLFGEMALLDGMPRSAEARALEPTIVLAIPYAPVQKLFEDDPQLLWGVVRMLSRRLRNMDEALADSVFLDVTGRTAKRLLELAGMVGASRERVNKAIASFIRLGWLAQQDRRYKVLQRDRLELRAR